MRSLSPKIVHWTRKAAETTTAKSTNGNAVALSAIQKLQNSLSNGTKLKPNVSSVFLSFAKRNSDMGARHFLKEDLPAVTYANPHVSFRIRRTVRKAVEPCLHVNFAENTRTAIPIAKRSSADIRKDFFNTAADA